MFKKNKEILKSEVGTEVQEEYITNHAEAQVILNQSRQWYQKQYKTVTKVALIEALTICMMTAIIILLASRETKQVYFAVNDKMEIIKLQPLSEPIYSVEGVMDFAAQTVRKTFQFNYLNYEEVISAQRTNYSGKAFKSIIASLNDAKIVKKVREERLSASCTFLEAPRLMKYFLLKGRKAWKLEVPLIISYESSQGVVLTQKLVADILVIRVDQKTIPQGIIIQQLVFKDLK